MTETRLEAIETLLLFLTDIVAELCTTNERSEQLAQLHAALLNADVQRSDQDADRNT